MKIQIRKSVFETNSSSMHSICIVSEKELIKFQQGKLNLNALYPEGEMTREQKPISYGYDRNHIWDWHDFIKSDEDGYCMIDDIEEFGDKFPPGSIEALGKGKFKLHYQI